MEDNIIVVEGDPTVPPTPPKSIDKGWSDSLRRRLNDSLEKPWRKDECSIFTVPHNLRSLDPAAYEPRVVSIGPYHRRKPNLQTMEKHKWRMARRLLSKCHDKKLEECLEKMMALENRVRSCYSEPIEMGSSEFAEMMFLDGCFILGVLLREKPDVEKMLLGPLHDEAMGEEEPERGGIQNLLYALELVDHDLLKIENQITFFIVEALFDLLLPPEDSERKQELPWPSGTGWMLSATEQKEAGVVFKPKRQGSFIDVTFKNGVMEIPVLCIYENTFPIFRNLIAFEQCYPNTMDHITYYASFMESMIKMPGDVKALQSEGILRIGKSNEVEVARLFNELCNEVFVNNSMSYLRELLYKVG
ncbi:UPF0481 protein [Acorus calamus]|uniref:UPF0481 protein n=1 Tax=Acorus calamus TaxID=4465 RepID=A0AAV9D631_ACOCL|nr:UPF0481 protein [Acorus calamus]